MKRMYVLASRQRNYSTPFVQGAHALSQFALEHPEQFREWGNHTLVFLECDDIERARARIVHKGIKCSSFFEPDYDNQLTAICTYTDNRCMSKYSLM